MKVLVTAGSTCVFLDKVRFLSNIFKGKTGTAIAKYFSGRYEYENSSVTLVTSNMKIAPAGRSNLDVIPYKTYDELLDIMDFEIKKIHYDIVIHSAAVSDYKPEGTYAIDIDEIERLLYLVDSIDSSDNLLSKLDIVKAGIKEKGWYKKISSSSKISSQHKELFLKLIPTEKIIDKIREDWGFKGKLVKFKLEVDLSENKLIKIARKSMEHSKADLIVANCLEWCKDKAYIIKDKSQVLVARQYLPEELFNFLQ